MGVFVRQSASIPDARAVTITLSPTAMAVAFALLIAVEFAALTYGYAALALRSYYTITLRLPHIEPLGSDLHNLMIAYLYAIAPLSWFSFIGLRPSKCLYAYLWLAVLVPTTIFTMTASELEAWARHLGCGASVLSFGVAYIAYALPLQRFKPLSHQRRIGWVAVAGIGALGVAFIAVTNPGALTSVDFFDVYEKRLELRDAIQTGAVGRLQVYLTNWMGLAIAPFLATYGLLTRRIPLVAAGLLVAYVAFAISTHKSVFFTTLIVMILAIFLTRRERSLPGAGGASLAVAITLVGMICTAVAIDAIFIGSAVFSWFVGFRMFSNNGFLTAIYLEFFQDEPVLLYADSFLRGFVSSGHELSYSRRVGDYVTWYDGRNNANANFLADGYVNLGYGGMLLAGLQLAVVLWIIDCAANGKNLVLSSCVVLPAGLAFSNLPIHTGLLSNGVGICILLLLLVPSAGVRRRPPSVRPTFADPNVVGVAPAGARRH